MTACAVTAEAARTYSRRDAVPLRRQKQVCLHTDIGLVVMVDGTCSDRPELRWSTSFLDRHSDWLRQCNCEG
ncbi:hypothetical protein HII31_11590 [Pseudocercospora fuligena]|uniref:Uncharacterized protein n=1 Tax=Pseudocercospora fuligena TaxID=685502 RepID=A0A8H6RBH8_9PEZI|nr:hypothetical protein HII31_11590 [Pseudocercospora fuligena]